MSNAMQWDIFCDVIDNFGDIGVCWRLACQLADRQQNVRLWCNHLDALRWMAGSSPPAHIEIHHWTQDNDWQSITPAPVVIEAFGCSLPNGFLDQMAQQNPQPRCINLEYLSAESYVERSHRLSSGQWVGEHYLKKWFFYPGFTAKTGGLLREAHLIKQRETFDPQRWLQQYGINQSDFAGLISVFCYPTATLAPTLSALTKLLLDSSADTKPVGLLFSSSLKPEVKQELANFAKQSAVRLFEMPMLTHAEFDCLLWSCDINLVRGEDSWVRAQWAAVPFIWNIYPQDDGADRPKLAAFLDLFTQHTSTEIASQLRDMHASLNGHSDISLSALSLDESFLAQWRQLCYTWREELLQFSDLCTQLQDFVVQID